MTNTLQQLIHLYPTRLGTLCVQCLAALFLSGCYDPIGEPDTTPSEPECSLTLTLFDATSHAQYPATVCVYGEEGGYTHMSTFDNANDTLRLTLPRGRYRLVALSGTACYHLPTDYALHSVISQNEALLPTSPLLMAQADVTLSSATATAALPLVPQAASLSFTATGVPSRATQVHATLSTLYTAVTLGGEWQSALPVTFPLVRNDLQWSTTRSYYLFPSRSSNLVLTLQVMVDGSTEYYSYHLPQHLDAGYDYNVQVSLAQGVLSPSIVISGEGNDLPSADTLTVSDFPTSAPSLWHGLVLAHMSMLSADRADILLISANEWDEVSSAYSADPTNAVSIARQYTEMCDINLSPSTLPNATSGLVTQWHIPTPDQATLLRSLYTDAQAYMLNAQLASIQMPGITATDLNGHPERYLCTDGQQTYSFAAGSTSISKAGTKATYRLRLVKQIHLRRLVE